jgi:hypothetical protein
VKVRAEVEDRDGLHTQAKRWFFLGHPHVGLADRSRVVLAKAHEHELTLKCGLTVPAAHVLDVFVGVGYHDEIPNLAYSQALATISTDTGHVVAVELPLPGLAIDGDALIDDLGPPIGVVLRCPPQTLVHGYDLHAKKRKCGVKDTKSTLISILIYKKYT